MKSLSILKLLAILTLVLSSCNGVVLTTLGEARLETVKTAEETFFIIDTSSDGFIYRKSAKELVKILPLTSAKLYEDNSFELEKGAVIRLHELFKNSGSFNVEKFVNPEWGGSSFVRLMVSEEHGELAGRAAIKYLMQDNTDYTLKTKVHPLFSYGGFNYYGFFVPFSIYWKLKGTELEVELFRSTGEGEQQVAEVRMAGDVLTREFVTQKIFFKPEKSSEVKSTSPNLYKKEVEERRQIRDINETLSYFANGFQLPLEKIERISSEFGLSREWILSSGKVYSRSIHLGVDYPKPLGTPVYAAAEGIIRYTHNGAYVGNTVIIEHGLGVYTDYSHMDTITVKVGELVKRGEQIGTVGSTGASTGAHLHWGVRIYGIPVDPRSLLTVADIYVP